MTSSEAVVEFDQGRAVRKLWRHLSLLVAGLLLGLVVAGVLVAVRGRTFTASSQVVVGQPATVQDILAVTSGTRTQVNSTTTVRDSQLRRLEDDRIKDAVATQLAGRPKYTLAFNSSTTSNVVTIVATSKSAATARDAADATGNTYVAGLSKDEDDLIAQVQTEIQANVDELTKEITTLEQTLVQATSTTLPQVQAIVGPARDDLLSRRGVLERELDTLNVAKNADINGARVSSPAEVTKSSVTGQIVLGGLLGLLLGLAAAALRETFVGRVFDSRDVLAAGLTPRAVSTVPVKSPRRPVGPDDDRLSAVDQSRLRLLAATLWPPHGASGASQVCLVAPADDQAAASAVLVARLARQLVVLGRRVTVVDGDAQTAAVASVFGIAGAPGVAEVVRGELTVTDLLARQGGSGLSVVPAGRASSPGDVYGDAFADLLRACAERADVVLVVGAPLTDRAEALVLTPLVDRLVVVVAQGSSRRKALAALEHSLAEQPSAPASVLAPDVLLHKLTGRAPRSSAAAAPEARERAATETPQIATVNRGSARMQDPALPGTDARVRLSE